MSTATKEGIKLGEKELKMIRESGVKEVAELLVQVRERFSKLDNVQFLTDTCSDVCNLKDMIEGTLAMAMLLSENGFVDNSKLDPIIRGLEDVQ